MMTLLGIDTIFTALTDAIAQAEVDVNAAQGADLN
jgi:hypothetical protein